MNLFKKTGYFFKAAAKSNKLTVLSTIRNVYKQYGWQGLKDAVVNKAHGKPIVPEILMNPYATSVHKVIAEKNIIGNWIFNEQQCEFTKEEILADISALAYKPLISIIMPLYNPPVNWLEIAIHSIQNQYYKNWELCLVDDGSKDGRGNSLIEKYTENDDRIRITRMTENKGISAASNISLEMAHGEYVALIDQDDEITPDAFYWFVKEINENKDADYIYSDECKINATAEKKLFGFFFKPDWSPALLLNYMYTAHLTVYKTELVKRAGGFRSEYDFSQDYDLALRASQLAQKICHIERVLYFWRAIATSAAADGKDFAITSNIMAARDWYLRNSFKPLMQRREGGNNARIVLENLPKVSIIIPTDSFENLKQSIDFINIRTSYTNYEIVPVVNSLLAEQLEECFPYYDSLHICKYDKLFNFSEKCNEGAKKAAGEILIFFNDDAYPHTKDWIERLLDILYLPDVGAVSPLMLYEDANKIQYAGAVSAHPEYGLNGPTFLMKDIYDLTGNNINQQHVREVSILSGACLAIKKDIFIDIDGFDANNTPNGHSDVEISFRLIEKGLRCVYTPYSCLIHPGSGTWAIKWKKDKADVYCLKHYKKYIERDRYFTDSMKKYEFGFKQLPHKVYYPVVFDGQKTYKGDLLLVSHELTRTGGPLVLFDMAKLLHENGYFVIVASPEDGPLKADMLKAGLIVIVDKALSDYRYKEDPEIPKDNFWYFDSFITNFDLTIMSAMLCHNLISRYNNVDIPIVWWLHEGDSTLDFLAPKLPKKVGENIRVLCVSQYVQNMLKRFGVEYDTDIFLYGVEDQSTQADLQKKEKIRFLLVGSFEKRKGHDLFIKAIEAMPKHYRNQAEFIFIGGKINEQDVYNMVVQFCNENDNAIVRQSLPREELFKIYDESLCVVAPSRDDPMPVVLTEALMFSKICICSDKTGTSYFIEDGKNGFVIQNEDYAALSQKMMDIIDNHDKMTELRQNGRRLYEQHFSMDVFQKNLNSVLNKALHEKNRNSRYGI